MFSVLFNKYDKLSASISNHFLFVRLILTLDKRHGTFSAKGNTDNVWATSSVIDLKLPKPVNEVKGAIAV
ncbi:hypothetical protein D3C85_1677580 [compost metagenome]